MIPPVGAENVVFKRRELPFHVLCHDHTFLTTHAGLRKAGILRHHQLHPAPGLRIATELPYGTEEVLNRHGLRTLGDKPVCAAVKTALGQIALEPRHRKIRRRMALRTGDLDRCEIGQIDIQQRVAHSIPFITAMRNLIITQLRR